jgi:hypothetical protein
MGSQAKKQVGGDATKRDSRKADQRGSDSLPIAVKLLNAGKSEEERTQDVDRIAEQKKTDRWTIALTFLIFAANAGMVYVAILQRQTLASQKAAMDNQESALRDTIVKMGEIADAQSHDTQAALGHAKTSADAAIAAARASEASVAKMDAQLAQTKEASHRELRAYIGIIADPMAALPSAGETPSFSFEVRNFGKTPAYDVDIRVGFAISPYPHKHGEAMHYALDDTERTSFVIDPGDSRSPQSRPGHQLTIFEAAAVQSGRVNGGPQEVALCISGLVTYLDAFGEKHSRPFCIFYLAPDGARAYCTCHNTSD